MEGKSIKIAYIGYLTQIDADIPLLAELQKHCDVTAYFYVNPKHIRKSVIKLNRLYPKTGIFDSDIYPEFSFLKSILDLSKVKIINVADGKFWQLRAFNQFRKLSKSINQEFDIAHLTGILQPVEWPLVKLKKKTLLTVHDPLPHSSTKDKLRFKLSRELTFRGTKHFLLFNKAQSQDFIRLNNLSKNCITIGNLSIYAWLKDLPNCSETQINIPERDYILFSGRISIYKGLQILLPAMKLVHEANPNIKLVVAGGGNFPIDITEYEKLDYIEFRHRFIPDVELVKLIQNCRFAVCPYIDATQSGVVMSTFAFCKPMLVTNVGGLPEMVHDNLHGKVIEPSNVQVLAKAIIDMYADSQSLAKYSENIFNDYHNAGHYLGHPPLKRYWPHIIK